MARDLAAVIAALRKRAGLSPLALAERAGIDTAIVYRIESGKKMPAFKTLCALAEALNVSLDDLAVELGFSGSTRSKASRQTSISTSVATGRIEEVESHLNAALDSLDRLAAESGLAKPTRAPGRRRSK
jgi:transcriptional regulator with XRE-family HTH domain